MSVQKFLYDSYLREHTSYVESFHIINNLCAIALAENIFRPSGGGQPRDHGTVIINKISYKVEDIIKIKGVTNLILDSSALVSLYEFYGKEANSILDWERRYCLMRYHTGGHILMSAARQTVLGYEPQGMEIEDDLSSCKILFTSEEEFTEKNCSSLLDIALNAIDGNASIEAKNYPSLDAAKEEHIDEFRINSNLNLKGKVRIIIIDNYDANPCSGTHVKSLGEVGSLTIESFSYESIERIASIKFKLECITS
ncbi:alanyl-tRNA editing protein [Nostoc sp.]|uniref:alanyl-tRNA editing protein n=1 Tax=Nostoc sp. TaxID=1180 RepID=UPI002FFC1F6E